MPESRPPGLFWALFCIASGLVPMLAALDVIPGPESSFHAPRWVVFIAGSLFFMVGMWLLLQALVGVSRSQALGSAIGFAIVVGLAFIVNWIAFGAGAREGCTGGFSFLWFESSRDAAERECRIAFLLKGIQDGGTSLWNRLKGKAVTNKGDENG